MKNIYLALFLFLTVYIQSQGQQDNFKSEYLETDKFKYGVSNIGLTRSGHAENNVYFQYEEEVSRISGGTSGICLATETTEGEMRAAISYLAFDQFTEFAPGIIDRDSNEPIIDNPYFDQIWKVEIHEIVQFQNDFANGNITTDIIPNSILQWPAKGNPYLPNTEIDFDLAPFNDLDNNGMYDPLLGDYPIALEEWPNFTPSEFTFTVVVEETSDVTFTPKLNVEVQQISYVINCKESPLSQGVNYRWKVTNLNDEAYEKLYLGVLDYPDMGCPYYNYTGTHLPTNSVYYYNNRSFDTDCNPSNKREIIECNISTSHQLNNTILGFPYNNDPYGSGIYTNLLNHFKSIWGDGTPLTFGGDGYNPASTDSVNYIFTDFPETNGGWGFDNATLTGDQSSTMLSGYDMESIDVGESKIFDFSKYIYISESEDISQYFVDYESQIEIYKSKLQEAKSGIINCQSIELDCTNNCVWPGDINRDGIVDDIDALYLTYARTITNTQSISRNRIDNQWYPHQSQDWNTDIIDVNMKHADTDGNAMIDDLDFESIDQNYKKINNNHISIDDIPVLHEDPFGISIIPDKIDIDFNNITEEFVIVDILLGNEVQSIENNIVGITFDIKMSESVNQQLLNQTAMLDNTFYSAEYRNRNEIIISNGTLDPASTSFLVRVPDTDIITNGGKLSTFGFIIDSTFTTQNIDGRDTLSIDLYNLTAISDEGDIVDIGIREKIDIYLSNVSLASPLSTIELSSSKLKVYPVPAKNSIYIETNEESNTANNLIIYNSSGTAVIQQKYDAKPINIEALQTGIYYIRLQSETDSQMTKFIKI